MVDYAKYGIRPVINASATLTKLGGSLMPAPVLDAMRGAAGAFLDLPEAHKSIAERLAEITRNEAAYISSGAAAGISLTVATCIVGSEPDTRMLFPQLEGYTRKEVVIFAGQRNGYDYACRETGAIVVESGPTEADLRSAIGPNTACVLFFGGENWAAAAPPLERVVEIAHELGTPVIVDAAAQIPPISNLWYYTKVAGADCAIFSGGKGLRGPQSSGLVVGRQWIIDGCHNHGSPNQAFGRPMKVGKEEMFGLLAAVEWSLEQDEPALLQRYEDWVQLWNEGFSGFPGVTAERIFPSEAGQPMPRTQLTIGTASGWTRDALVDALWEGSPRIAVAALGDDRIALNPQTVMVGEEVVVRDTLRALLASRAAK